MSDGLVNVRRTTNGRERKRVVVVVVLHNVRAMSVVVQLPCAPDGRRATTVTRDQCIIQAGLGRFSSVCLPVLTTCDTTGLTRRRGVTLKCLHHEKSTRKKITTELICLPTVSYTHLTLPTILRV